jgi:hypothetical protein
MHVLACALALMVVTLSAGVCASSQALSPQSKEVNASGTVAGRITIAGKPAANVSVGLTPDPPITMRERFSISGTTDADGHFQLTPVPAGRYRVMAYAPAFYHESDGSSFGQGKLVTLAEGETVDDLTIPLRRGGVITGRLTDQTGRPMIQEHINLYRINPRGEKNEYSMSNYNISQTDDRGVYRIYGLPPGRYLVSAGTPTRQGAARIGFGNSYYAQSYYPGVSDETKANEVEVTEGGEASGIDITLGGTERAYTVTLRLTAADSSKPVAGIHCGYGALDPGGRYIGSSAIGAESNAQGECRLDGLLPGKYMALLLIANDGPNYGYEPVPFEVVDADVNNIEIKLQQGASISGTVVVEGMNLQDAATHFPELMIGVSTSAPISVPRFSRPQINADGSFYMGSLPTGKVRLTVTSFPRHNAVLLRVERDGNEVTEGFDLAAGDAINGVRLVIGIGTAVLHGEVKMADGAFPEGTRLFISARRVGDSSPQNNFHAETDSRGRFVFDGLMPGDYEINAGNGFSVGGAGAVPVRFKPVRKTVSVSNENEAQVTIVLERATGNN